jgi:hypothetical protein
MVENGEEFDRIFRRSNTSLASIGARASLVESRRLSTTGFRGFNHINKTGVLNLTPEPGAE